MPENITLQQHQLAVSQVKAAAFDELVEQSRQLRIVNQRYLEQAQLLQTLCATLQCQPAELVDKVEGLVSKSRSKQKSPA